MSPFTNTRGPGTRLPGEVQVLLDGANTAHLATLLPDGSPHSVPVWVGTEGAYVVFLTAPSSRKARNVERDSRVAISITQRDKPTTMAAVRGRVVQRVDGDAGWAIIDRIAVKYLGGPYPRDEDRAAFLIQPSHAWARAF